MAIAVLAAVVALAVVALTSGAEPESDPGKKRTAIQRVAIVSEGVQNTSGAGQFALRPLEAGAVTRDSGTVSATWSERVVMRAGQRVAIDNGVETLKGKRGSLRTRFRIEWVEAGNGYFVGDGTWKVVRGTGQYAEIAGGGRGGHVWLERGRGPWSSRLEGVLSLPSDAFTAGPSCRDFIREGPGRYPLKVDVVEGSVPCRVVQRVLDNYYYGRNNDPWICVGQGDPLVECSIESGAQIRGRLLAPRTRRAVDAEAGVRFWLHGGTLKVRTLPTATRKTRARVRGERIRASCGHGFASVPGDDRRQARTRVWPAGRALLRYRFRPDMARIATWCRLEHRADGHVAFVMFGKADSRRNASLSPEQKITRTGRRWARLFAAGDRRACRYMTPTACGHLRPSRELRRSFAGAKVEEISIRENRASARFSNGEGVELDWVNGYAVGGVWWIHDIGGQIDG
jgi:hypothetical protein